MDRRTFLSTLGLAAAGTQIACAPRVAGTTAGTRRLRRVGIQLYTLRDDARRDLEGTLVNIARTGYKEVELLGSYPEVRGRGPGHVGQYDHADAQRESRHLVSLTVSRDSCTSA